MTTIALNPIVVCFVNLMFTHADVEPGKIDLSDAIFMLCQWMAEGQDIPEGMTPGDLLVTWNHMVDCMNRYPDAIGTDDDDSI